DSPQHRVTLAEDRGEVAVEIPARLERPERPLGVGGAHPRIAAVLHLEPLHRELDVDDAATAELDVVATRPLLRELLLHPRPKAMHARGIGGPALVRDLRGEVEDLPAEARVPRARPSLHERLTLPVRALRVTVTGVRRAVSREAVIPRERVEAHDEEPVA